MLSNQRLPDGVYIQTINTTSINSITPKRNVNGFIALYYFKILLPQKANPTENKIPTMNIPIILISIFSDWNYIAIPPSTNAVNVSFDKSQKYLPNVSRWHFARSRDSPLTSRRLSFSFIP